MQCTVGPRRNAGQRWIHHSKKSKIHQNGSAGCGDTHPRLWLCRQQKWYKTHAILHNRNVHISGCWMSDIAHWTWLTPRPSEPTQPHAPTLPSHGLWKWFFIFSQVPPSTMVTSIYAQLLIKLMWYIEDHIDNEQSSDPGTLFFAAYCLPTANSSLNSDQFLLQKFFMQDAWFFDLFS